MNFPEEFEGNTFWFHVMFFISSCIICLIKWNSVTQSLLADCSHLIGPCCTMYEQMWNQIKIQINSNSVFICFRWLQRQSAIWSLSWTLRESSRKIEIKLFKNAKKTFQFKHRKVEMNGFWGTFLWAYGLNVLHHVCVPPFGPNPNEWAPWRC